MIGTDPTIAIYALRSLATGELYVATGSVARDRWSTREEAQHACRVIFGTRARAYEVVNLNTGGWVHLGRMTHDEAVADAAVCGDPGCTDDAPCDDCSGFEPVDEQRRRLPLTAPLGDRAREVYRPDGV